MKTTPIKIKFYILWTRLGFHFQSFNVVSDNLLTKRRWRSGFKKKERKGQCKTFDILASKPSVSPPPLDNETQYVGELRCFIFICPPPLFMEVINWKVRHHCEFNHSWIRLITDFWGRRLAAQDVISEMNVFFKVRSMLNLNSCYCCVNTTAKQDRLFGGKVKWES